MARREPGEKRQKIAVGRAILKRPAVLVLDQAAAVLDPSSQNRLLASVLAERKACGVYWVLNRPDLAERFGQVLMMEKGRLVARGKFAELREAGGPFEKLIVA